MPIIPKDEEIIGWRKISDEENIFLCKACYLDWSGTEENREKIKIGEWEAFTKSGMKKGLKYICDSCGEEFPEKPKE